MTAGNFPIVGSPGDDTHASGSPEDWQLVHSTPSGGPVKRRPRKHSNGGKDPERLLRGTVVGGTVQSEVLNKRIDFSGDLRSLIGLNDLQAFWRDW